MARLGPGEFAVQLWDGEQWPREPGGSADFKLIFRIPNVVRSMFSNINSLSFGEAYIYGHLDVEGSLIDVFESGDRLLTIHYPASEKLRLPRWLWSIPAVKYPGNGTFGGFARRNTSTAAHIRAAVNYHYDHPVDFWKLWLDESLSYSCAYFDSPEIYSRQLKRTISIISAESCVSRPGSGCSIWDVAGDQTEARSQRSPAHARGLVSSGAGRVKPRLNRLNRDKSAPRSCSSGSGPAATAANFWNRARVTDCAIQMQSHPGRVNGPSCRVPLSNEAHAVDWRQCVEIKSLLSPWFSETQAEFAVKTTLATAIFSAFPIAKLNYELLHSHKALPISFITSRCVA